MKKTIILIFCIFLISEKSLCELNININNKINIFNSNFNEVRYIFFKNDSYDNYILDGFKNQNEISDNNLKFFFSHFNEYPEIENDFNSENIGFESEVNNLSNNDSSNYVTSQKFVYADNQRFTFTGTPALINSKIKPFNVAAILGSYSLIFYVQHSMQQNTIWKEVGPFHIYEDIQYALWVDKFGHFYGGYATSYLLSEMLMLSGTGWETSTLLGGLLGLSYMTYVEVLDGYSKGFGFSPSDFYADVAGAGFFVAQYYLPILQNFSPKFEYVNPKWLGELDRLPHDSFIDNYSAQSFWLSINIRNLIGGKFKQYVPDWINLAVGYAAYSLCTSDWKTGEFPYDKKDSYPVNDITAGNRKLIIALDYDLVKLLPDGPPFWNWMKQSLNLFKLPSPALEIGFEGKTKLYLLYPFEFRLSGFRI